MYFSRSIFAVFVSALLMMLALQVVGSDLTAIQGGAAVLACSLAETKASVSHVSWQKQTIGQPQLSDFVTITPEHGPRVINGDGPRVNFIGNFEDRNGSLELSSITLMDEGIYTCAFTLFSGGTYRKEIALYVAVPPVSRVVDNHPVLGDEEVILATCTAAGAKPPASVSWLTGDVHHRTVSSAIQHDNGTVTTFAWLVGEPSKELENQLAHCVISSPDFKDQILPFNMQIYFPPTEVEIRQQTGGSLKCEAEANPAATFVWTRIDGPWPQASVAVDGATLTVLTKTSSLNGLYQCEASNQHGSTYTHLHVHVTEDHCEGSWTLLSISLLFSVVVVVGMWLLYRSGIVTRIPLVEERKAFQTGRGS